MGLEEAPDLSGIRVLVVEDDDDARALVEKVLSSQGASVRSVSNGQCGTGHPRQSSGSTCC